MLRSSNVFSTFSVPDIEAAKRFYGDVLGLQTDVTEMGMLELTLPNGGNVTAYPKQDHKPATFTILNFIVPDVDVAVDELAAAGVEMERYDMPDLKTDARGVMRGRGPDIAWFKDPFGNILSVIGDPSQTR